MDLGKIEQRIPGAVSAGDVASVAAVAVSCEAKVNVWKNKVCEGSWPKVWCFFKIKTFNFQLTVKSYLIRQISELHGQILYSHGIVVNDVNEDLTI